MHVVATAGHVDHGKSTLVRALTGMEPDRWAEERRRGMTLDLGFAWTTLPSGAGVAFVDVPGHERFVPTMLAGVGPVPAVLLVVAADGGWMPQSAEHLAAIDALGVRHGLIAVTRSDLADPGPAIERARAEAAATSLGAVPAVAVSGSTGAGLSGLRAALDRLVAGVPAPSPVAPVRLWVDRAFTVRGSGTVVTGTLGAGTLRVGDELELVPGGRRVAVRGLQSQGVALDTVSGTARVAVNLRGVPVDAVARGVALVTPGAWTSASTLDGRVLGPPSSPLPATLVLHAGSAALPVHVRPLGTGAVRLRSEGELPLHVGDRLVLRDPARRVVVGGLRVLDVDPPALRRRGAAAARAAELSTQDGRPDGAGELRRRGAARAATLRAMGVPEPADAVRGGDWLVDPDQAARWRAALAAAVAAHAAAHPLDHGLPLDAARQRLDLPDTRLIPTLLAAAATPPAATLPAAGLPAAGLDGGVPGGGAGSVAGVGVAPAPPSAGSGDAGAGLVVRDGRVTVAAANAVPVELRAAVDAVRADLTAAPYAAPEAHRLTELGLGRRELAAAVRAGALLRVADGIHLLPGADDRAAHLLAAAPQPFTLSEARRTLGTTRRVAVPLLELLDRRGLTERLPDDRRRLRGPGHG